MKSSSDSEQSTPWTALRSIMRKHPTATRVVIGIVVVGLILLFFGEAIGKLLGWLFIIGFLLMLAYGVGQKLFTGYPAIFAALGQLLGLGLVCVGVGRLTLWADDEKFEPIVDFLDTLHFPTDTLVYVNLAWAWIVIGIFIGMIAELCSAATAGALAVKESHSTGAMLAEAVIDLKNGVKYFDEDATSQLRNIATGLNGAVDELKAQREN